MRFGKSAKLYREASKYLVGGVNSPVRAFKAVGGRPIFIRKGRGSKIYDADGNSYIDYLMSWGALILGHSHPLISRQIKAALTLGTSFGACTENEVKLAKVISGAIGSIEMLRLVNSGTEAVMSAIRLSRGYTGRDKIIKFEGAYHGHYDSLLVRAGSGLATFSISDSLGVPKSFSRQTIVLPYNDIDKTAEVIKRRHKEIACLIVEPVCANMGVVLPKKHFLLNLRELTAKHKIVLIFDEVITGFRFLYGGAQNLYGIKPDLTCLGKIIGAGLPIGAYGGRREIMENLAPQGRVYQAGTLSGNPIATSAGLAALETLSGLDYQALNQKTENLCQELGRVFREKNTPFWLNRAGSMFTVFFTKNKVYDFRTARQSDIKRYAFYFWSMLRQGINLAPSQFEANFFSFAHSDDDLKFTIAAIRKFKGFTR